MSDLLKQAIADAKAVRATALANAKAALEEAFAPKLQSMLATKLQQEVEAEDGDELPEEPAAPVDAPVTDEVPVADAPAPDAGVDGAPAEAPIDAPAPEAACEPAPEGEVPVPSPEGVADEELPIDEFSMEEGGTAASTTITASQDAENLAEEKASPDYKKTTKGHHTEDPQGPSKELSKGPGKADKAETAGKLASKGGAQKASPDYKKTTTGHKTPDPQGPSKELAKGPGKADKNETGKVLEEDNISEETLDEILRELESEVTTPNDQGAQAHGDTLPAGELPQGPLDVDEEIDLSSLLESDDKDDDKKEDKDEDKEDNKPEWLKENISLKQELEEYRNAVQYLRDRINEVNLLNAKLLYTNKLFKQAQLTNEQKLKVIEQFDLTKSVREAKLTYANLSESLSFGAKSTTKAAPAPVAKKAAVVKTIAEGLASKAVGSTKPTKAAVITEGAEMANRFKKLAGIRSK